VRLRYYQIAGVLKWLALVLLVYFLAAVEVGPHWSDILPALAPKIPRGEEAWQTVVAIFGTTISPYLFFWQASQEVEEKKAAGRRMTVRRRGATPTEIFDRKLDVGLGTFFSNIVMFCVILTTALTLNPQGVTRLETSREVALALRPLAGELAGFLYTAGIVGVGLLAIPTLSGSAAYAFAETFGWRQGLDQKLVNARAFYGVILFSTFTGVLLDFAEFNPVRALYWSAVVNGLLAPLLLVGILLVATDREIMQGQTSSWLGRSAVALTALLMFAAAAGMFLLGT
jgi:Mn2+/Fe2+ NRAMP family transporter